MADFRALCVELTEVLRRQHDWYIEDNGATLPQLDKLVARAQAALAEADGPAVSDDRELASVTDSLALRVQRLEAMREFEKATLLDAFRQIDDLKHRIDLLYWKIHQLEEATDTTAPETDD